MQDSRKKPKKDHLWNQSYKRVKPYDRKKSSSKITEEQWDNEEIFIDKDNSFLNELMGG